MVDALAASQEVSLVASQFEVDPAAKAQKAAQGSQNALAGLLLKLIENSFETVHSLVEIEQEDPLRDEDEEDSLEE